jgi:hypothetical protein
MRRRKKNSPFILKNENSKLDLVSLLQTKHNANKFRDDLHAINNPI